jgi:tRNA G10  N-methylase Trm11
MIFGQNKQKYIFILGHVPKLSSAEVKKILEFRKIDYKIELETDLVLIIEASHQLEPKELQSRLGGTIKIALLKAEVTAKDLADQIGRIIKTRAKDLKTIKKFQFGFSVYGQANYRLLEKIGLQIKKELKTLGLISRLVVSKLPELSSVIVKKENLIEQGIDLIVVSHLAKFYLGQTLSVQDFEDYSQKDYGRPARDDRSGMLPPKVAKIIINLAQANNQQIILDPFCGSGTVLQEARLLGFDKLIGTDISAKAIDNSQNNLNWLKTKYQLGISKIKIFKQDVLTIAEAIGASTVDRIITEPYLGPKDLVPLNQTYKIISQLNEFYLLAFKQFYQILKTEGKIVIIFPVINRQKMEILTEIKNLGFKIEPLGDDERGSLIYKREQQRVWREIFIFKKI